MITTKERATLRGIANNFKDDVLIGKDNVSKNVIKQVSETLLAKELIKIKVLKNCELQPREVCDVLVKELECEPISVVGSKIVIYKKTTKKGFKHYL